MNRWCQRAWIKFGCGITAIVVIAILAYWNAWSTELKIIAAIAALIPIHVVEEWVFPGGFHYQYNILLYKSDQPDRYPMCRKSDMYTNLLATFLYIGLATYSLVAGGVSTGIIMGTVGFCALEVFLHTVFGSLMYKRMKAQGKTTIYGPGSITAYLGFGVFGTILVYSMCERTITATDWWVCAGVLAFILLVCILIPESTMRTTNETLRYPVEVNPKGKVYHP